MTVCTSSPTCGNRIELLEDFPAQRFGVRLAVMDLAAGEFPVTREVSAVRTQRQQKGVVALDDGGDDGDGCHFGAEAPTGTGCTQASLPFDSITFART